MQKTLKTNGFTLVELIVSVTITAILMLGMSVFFSSTFRNMFAQREQEGNSQSQFVVNTILREKFANVTGLDDSGSDHAVIRNNTSRGDLPFTYIGEDGGHIVFKDFFPFNGRFGADQSANAAGINNPAGLTKKQGPPAYFVASPLENGVYLCTPGLPDCFSQLGLNGSYTELDSPMDVAFDQANSMLYIADSGHGRIISVDLGAGQKTDLVADELDFPVGLEFYSVNGNDYLFFSEPYQNRVSRIRTDGSDKRVVAGAGENESCDSITAEFCKLNFPTGLLVADNGLFIADTGNRRILKLTDPGPPANQGGFERIPFTFGGQYAVEKISFRDFENEGLVASTLTDSINGSYDSGLHEMQATPLFTAYENNSCGWTLNGTSHLYIDHTVTDISNVDVGDIVSVEENTYEVLAKTGSRLVCDDGGDPPSILDRAHMLTLDGNISGVSNGSEIYFGSVDQAEETIDLQFLPNSFLTPGFQNVIMDVYEFGNVTPVETHKHPVRVGDGELGSEEDLITIAVASNPSNTFITGLGWNGGLEFSSTPGYDTNFSDYDYTSTFDVQSVVFEPTNSGNVLQLSFDAELGRDLDGQPLWENFIFDANVTPTSP